MSSTNSKQSELYIKSSFNIDGFFGKQQYAAIALNRTTIKSSKLLCLKPKVTVRGAR